MFLALHGQISAEQTNDRSEFMEEDGLVIRAPSKDSEGLVLICGSDKLPLQP